ncbi:ABC transporter permease [Salipiger thiooxidans]|uniref:ABC transporter permease n=1 Tax=Salipiger thiooxidans TaxID=282683 RepID=UPI001A8C4CE0|nr:ABC transporter permease [Salipiger thiooxidans]MBN8188823.1 ABC transporter permease [Salipiger thiooxidans]
MIRFTYAAIATIVIGFIVLPMVLIVWMSFFSNPILSFPPEGYTLDWYRRAWSMSDFRGGFFTSLQISLCATVLALVLGIPASMALVRGSFPGRDTITTLLMAPMLVPAIVGGSALFVFYLEVELLSGVQMAGRLAGLIIAHGLIALPWVVKLVTTALTGMNQSVEEAAASLGAPARVVFLRITVPMIWPGVVAGGLFAFVNSFIDLEKSLFLVGPGRTTLQIALINYLEWNFDPTIGAVATAQIAFVTLLLLVTSRYVKLHRAF